MIKYYIILFIVFAGSAILLSGNNYYYITPPILVVLLLISPPSFHIFLNWKFILFILFLVFGIPLFLGEKTGMIWGVPYSKEYFNISHIMVQRSIIILLSIKMLTNQISLNRISLSLQNTRFKNFGQVFSVALKVLPEIKGLVKSSFQEYRADSHNSHFLKNLSDWVVKLIVRIITFADQYYIDHFKKGKIDR